MAAALVGALGDHHRKNILNVDQTEREQHGGPQVVELQRAVEVVVHHAPHQVESKVCKKVGAEREIAESAPGH